MRARRPWLDFAIVAPLIRFSTAYPRKRDPCRWIRTPRHGRLLPPNQRRCLRVLVGADVVAGGHRAHAPGRLAHPSGSSLTARLYGYTYTVSWPMCAICVGVPQEE